MKVKYFLLIIFLFFFSCNSEKKTGVKTAQIDTWQVKFLNRPWLKVRPPFSIQKVLRKDTLIFDYFLDNSFYLQKWTDTVSWEIKADLFMPNEIFKHKNIRLVFPFLDTYAKVFINDSLIFKADNFFRNYKIDLKNLVSHGSNSLVIKFVPTDKILKTQKNIPYFLPHSGLELIRKPYFQFDTLGGMSYVTSGLDMPEIVYWNNVKIDDIQIVNEEVSTSMAKLKFNVWLEASENFDNGIFVLKHKNKTLIKQKLKIEKGLKKYEFTLKIKNPHLWWTYDMGEPYLYKFNFQVFIGKNLEDVKKINYGIRKFEIDTVNNEIFFKLNGKDFYPKIVEHRPISIFREDVNKSLSNYFYQLKYSLANMIYVSRDFWYETDRFYEYCDKNGILVWQDIMLAYDIYPPLTEKWILSFQEELAYQVKRLRNHPSLAFWSIRKRFDKQWKKYSKFYSKEDSAKVFEIHNKLFYEIVAEQIKKYDFRPYFPDMKFKNIILITDKTVAFPHIKTLRYGISSQNLRYDNLAFKRHFKPYLGYQDLVEKIKKISDLPVNIENLIYLSQLYTYNEYLEKVGEFKKLPKVNGLLIENFSDYSPVISYSAVDYLFYPKGKYYAIREIYSPLTAVINEKNGWITIDFISEYKDDISVDIYFKLSEFTGKTLWRKNYPNQNLKGSRQKNVYKFDLRKMLKQSKNDIVFKVELYKDQELTLEKYYFFVSNDKLSLTTPQIKYKVFKIDEGYLIELTTNYLAKDVFLISTHYHGVFSKNFINILPGESKKVIFYTKDDFLNDFEQSLRIVDFTKRFEKF